MNTFLDGKYSVGKIIGHGAFGEINEGVCLATGQKVAIKKEEKLSKNPQLRYEAKVARTLEGGMGIPRIYREAEMDRYNCIVMDLLGPSLEDMLNACHRRFSEKTVLMLGIEMLTRLEFVHHRHIIHRDIKPDNFVIGLGNRANVVYILDFGLSKRYRDAITRKHIRWVMLEMGDGCCGRGMF